MSRETGVLRRGRIFRGIYGQIKRVMKRVGQRDFRDSLWEAEVSSRFLVKREEGCRKKKNKNKLRPYRPYIYQFEILQYLTLNVQVFLPLVAPGFFGISNVLFSIMIK